MLQCTIAAHCFSQLQRIKFCYTDFKMLQATNNRQNCVLHHRQLNSLTIFWNYSENFASGLQIQL